MSYKDESKREVSATELGQIKAKYPEMTQKFEDLKKRLMSLT